GPATFAGSVTAGGLLTCLGAYLTHRAEPATSPAAGAFIYVDQADGLPKFKGPNGTVYKFSLTP
ncbi:MAG TPA: hypothetical protein VF595_05425, partial [Tepidisphaeraceae bacterium]